MDRIPNRPKMPPRIKTASDALKADKAEIARLKQESMESLSSDPVMSKIIRTDLKLTKKEVGHNLALLLEVQDDRAACLSCKDKKDCPKTMKRRVIIPVKNEDGTLTRNYSVCEKEEGDFLVSSRFFLLSCPREWVDGSQRLQSDRFSRKQAYKALIGVLQGKTDSWVYLTGTSGSGKSFVAASIAAEYAKKHPGCAIASTPRLLEDLKSLSINSKAEFERQLKRLQECPLLVLDEFGNEYQTEYVYSNILFPILSGRSREKLPTFFASDFGFDDIAKMYESKIGEVKARQLKMLLKERCGREYDISGLPID